MPKAFIKKESKEKGISPATGEKKYAHAVDIAKKQGSDNPYALATHIFKGMKKK